MMAFMSQYISVVTGVITSKTCGKEIFFIVNTPRIFDKKGLKLPEKMDIYIHPFINPIATPPKIASGMMIFMLSNIGSL